MKRLIATLCALALGGSALTACAPPTAQTPTVPTTPTHAGIPLPPGAMLDHPGKRPAETPEQDFVWEGSLAPQHGEDGGNMDVERIKQRGRIIVGIDQSQYLLSYRDSTTGTMRGFEVDLATEIARDIFGAAPEEHLDFRFVDSATRTELLQNGQVDVVLRTMSITAERAQKVAFSTPYLTSHVRILAPHDRGITDVGDLPGHTICVVDGTNLVTIVRTIGSQSPVLRTRSWSDCLMATQQFQADAILADDAILAGMTAQDPLTEILPAELATQRYAAGIAKDKDGLVRQVNATIERIRGDGTWQRMYDRWLRGSLVEPTPPPLHYRAEEPTND